MKGNLVITIGRQCGSNGKIIGQKIAEKLGVKCYDKELLNLAAKNSGLCEELFETHDACFFAPKIEYGTLRHLLFSF